MASSFKSFFIFFPKEKYILLSTYLIALHAKIPKMAMVILNSLVVHKGFLKRQGGIIRLIDPNNIVIDF